jgi:hypothetical protein
MEPPSLVHDMPGAAVLEDGVAMALFRPIGHAVPSRTGSLGAMTWYCGAGAGTWALLRLALL